jgi:uncharacterized protein
MIRNLTRKNVICSDEKVLKYIWQQVKGLMFTFKMKKPLLFCFSKEKKQNFHMFFVFYPIDLIFIDKNKKVVEIKENFKPFAVFKSNNNAQYVLELENKGIYNSKTKVGDQLEFIGIL